MSTQPVSYSLPVAQGSVQTGTVLVREVPEGYECRWYKLPAVTGPGTYDIPAGEMEFLYAGLYGKDRKLIRVLDA